MMPVLKWKMFRMVSYLHLTCTLVLSVITLDMIIDDFPRGKSNANWFAISIFLVSSPSLLSNSSINIYLLERYYPDKLPGKRLRTFSVILFILSLLVVILTTGLTVAAIFYELNRSSRIQPFKQRFLGYGIAATLAVISLTGFYILWNQVSLRKAIRRNYQASMDNFLVSDQP